MKEKEDEEEENQKKTRKQTRTNDILFQSIEVFLFNWIGPSKMRQFQTNQSIGSFLVR